MKERRSLVVCDTGDHLSRQKSNRLPDRAGQRFQWNDYFLRDNAFLHPIGGSAVHVKNKSGARAYGFDARNSRNEHIFDCDRLDKRPALWLGHKVAPPAKFRHEETYLHAGNLSGMTGARHWHGGLAGKTGGIAQRKPQLRREVSVIAPAGSKPYLNTQNALSIGSHDPDLLEQRDPSANNTASYRQDQQGDAHVLEEKRVAPFFGHLRLLLIADNARFQRFSTSCFARKGITFGFLAASSEPGRGRQPTGLGQAPSSGSSVAHCPREALSDSGAA